MKTLINRMLTGKIVLIFFAVSSSLYFLMLLVTIPHLHKITNGVKIIDMMPAGYNFDYVNQLMEALGETGRHYYLFRQIPIDLFFPFFFALSNCLIIAWFLKKLNRLNSQWSLACYLPFFAGFFDYAENFSVISIINNYPELNESTIRLSNLFSILKSSLTTISLLILLSVFLIYQFNRFSKSREKF